MSKRKMKLKRRKKRLFRIKMFLLLTLFFVGITTTSSFLKQILNVESFFPNLLENMNHHNERSEGKSIVTNLLSFFSPRNAASFLEENNHAFLTEVDPDDGISLEDASKLSDYVHENVKPLSSSPIVYIYNTHQREQYNMENLQPYNITPNVMMASYMMQEALKGYSISSIVEESDVTDILKKRELNYASSYKVTKELMTSAKNKYPTLEFFIDLHRDSVSKKVSTTVIENKSYAKVMFLVGVEHKNYEANLSFITKINGELEKKYPGISRGIWEKGGEGVNGIYNQDFNSHTILIEVGGQENTIEEVYNTIMALANVLAPFIKGE